MSYLLDTCILSELIKKKPEKSVVTWIKNVDEIDCYISVITFGEIQKGISKLAQSRKKENLFRWLENDLKQRFHERLIDITVEISLLWGEILGNSEKKGIVIPVMDALIASSALVNDLVVVTRNIKDIAQCGAQTFNPWS